MGGTEQYLKPKMEVIDLSGEDVIVTSSTTINTCSCNIGIALGGTIGGGGGVH